MTTMPFTSGKLIVACPKCGERAALPASAAGRKGRCNRCMAVFEINAALVSLSIDGVLKPDDEQSGVTPTKPLAHLEGLSKRTSSSSAANVPSPSQADRSTQQTSSESVAPARRVKPAVVAFVVIMVLLALFTELFDQPAPVRSPLVGPLMPTTRPESPRERFRRPGLIPKVVPAAVPAAAPAAYPRVRLEWWDATNELQWMARGLPGEEAALLGLSVLLTGTDIYGARVRLTNTGNVPIVIQPNRIFIHYGAQKAITTTARHPSFLTPCSLEPGHYVEGLVMYGAAVDVGAQMRRGAGRLSYEDPRVNIE